MWNVCERKSAEGSPYTGYLTLKCHNEKAFFYYADRYYNFLVTNINFGRFSYYTLGETHCIMAIIKYH